MRLLCCELKNQTGHEAGRALLRQLYREETGKELPPIRVTALGKPCFSEGNLHFSISHTKRHAFCVLSERNVGLDAEELDRVISPKLAEKILSPKEKARYDAAEDKPRALLTFWVLKEADAKRTGQGLRIYPNHTDFSLNDPAVREMEGCLVAILEDHQEGDHYAV